MICPKCKGENIECDTPDEPWYFSCTCTECEFEFCYDDYRSEYYTIDGGDL